MALDVYFNIDTQDLPLNSTGVNWLQFSEGNDALIVSAGSTEVIDGANIPTQAELISAGIILTGSQIIVDKYFISDASANLLEQIINMGNLDKQYVVAFDFDGATASEPVLEVYDDSDLDTISGTILGSGTASNSFIKGVTTTTSSPGINWAVGGGVTKMAGSASGNFLYLNDQNGPIIAAATLYCNLAYVIPASQTVGFSANPVFVVKWLDN